MSNDKIVRHKRIWQTPHNQKNLNYSRDRCIYLQAPDIKDFNHWLGYWVTWTLKKSWRQLFFSSNWSEIVSIFWTRRRPLIEYSMEIIWHRNSKRLQCGFLSIRQQPNNKEKLKLHFKVILSLIFPFFYLVFCKIKMSFELL